MNINHAKRTNNIRDRISLIQFKQGFSWMDMLSKKNLISQVKLVGVMKISPF